MRQKSRITLGLSLFALTLALFGVSVGRAQDADRPDLAPAQAPAPDSEAARIFRGYQINPVPLRLRSLDRDLVGLGSYLVNGPGGCNDCHTNPSFAPGGDPFMGQPKHINTAHFLAGGQAFGPFTSRNLTPLGTKNLPAGLTLAQFRQVMRTGVDPDHEHPQLGPLLQVMPWPSYQNLTDRDIAAIYEYLRAIPHAEPGTSSS